MSLPCERIESRTLSSVTSTYGWPTRCSARSDFVTIRGSTVRSIIQGYAGMMLPGDVDRGSCMCS